MRLTVPLLVLVAALAVPAVVGAAVDPKAPRQRHVAADMKRAAALALRPKDLTAGWKLDPPPKPVPPCTAGSDESNMVQTAKVDPSFTWKDGVTNVGSEVDFFRTAAEARRDWRVSTLALMRTCLLQSARSGVGQKVQVSIVSAKRLAAPGSAERSLYYRFVFQVGPKQAARLVTDVVALGRGRITVVLHSVTVRAPLPPAVVRALVRVLADRLNATKAGLTA